MKTSNRGARILNGYPDGSPLRCPWCGWGRCDCEPPEFPDTWAGDLMLVAFAHRNCGEDRCSGRWVARGSSWNCPWFKPSRTKMLKRLQWGEAGAERVPPLDGFLRMEADPSVPEVDDMTARSVWFEVRRRKDAAKGKESEI